MQITEKLIQKSKEAFMMAIEVYNKPSHFNLFCQYFGIKSNAKLCYTYKVSSQPQYSYSLQTIDFIVEEIKKDPESIIRNLKEKLKKNKSTPGAKEF